ncbi:MAG TPA: nuclear transport factor 2 family protein [Candidatus Dormibacteraeota bacterium]
MQQDQDGVTPQPVRADAQPRDLTEAPVHVQTAMRAYAALNAKDLDAAIPELDEQKTCMTRAEVKASLSGLLGAFSDLTVSNLRAYELDRGRVAVRFTISGTNDGPVAADKPATGKHIESEMTDLWQFDEAGRVISAWNLSNLERIRQQLGQTDA